jgi:hypothetical protein
MQLIFRENNLRLKNATSFKGMYCNILLKQKKLSFVIAKSLKAGHVDFNFNKLKKYVLVDLKSDRNALSINLV